MRVPNLNIDELVDMATMNSSPDHHYYLNLETGEVLYVYDDDPDQDEDVLDEIEDEHGTKYLELPEQDSDDGYRDMVAFVNTVDSDPLRSRLEQALSGRKPFRVFKEVLFDDLEERQRWFTFQETRIRVRVINWLTEHGIEVKQHAIRNH